MNEVSSFPRSRRGVLQFLGFGGAAFVLRPFCLAAAEKIVPKISFIVVSDTHLGYRDQTAAARQWEQTAAEIAKVPAGLVLHLGDVVDGGREAQYPIYLKTREKIPHPVHEIPGNHDPANLFEKHLRRPIDTTVDHQWLRFALLNNSRTDSHDGFLSDQQLTWIERQCVQATRDKKHLAICMHVPAHANRHPDRGWYVKPANGQGELYDVLAKHKDRVLCLMHGHFHNGLRGWDDQAPLHEISFPSALYNQSRRLEEQNAPGFNLPEFRPGYTVVTIEQNLMTLRYQPVGTSESARKLCDLKQLKSI